MPLAGHFLVVWRWPVLSSVVVAVRLRSLAAAVSLLEGWLGDQVSCHFVYLLLQERLGGLAWGAGVELLHGRVVGAEAWRRVGGHAQHFRERSRG